MLKKLFGRLLQAPVLRNLLLKFVKTFLYALGGVVVVALMKVAEVYQPTDPQQEALWKYLILPAIIAIIPVIKRWIGWDETKVGK